MRGHLVELRRKARLKGGDVLLRVDVADLHLLPSAAPAGPGLQLLPLTLECAAAVFVRHEMQVQRLNPGSDFKIRYSFTSKLVKPHFNTVNEPSKSWSYEGLENAVAGRRTTLRWKSSCLRKGTIFGA